MIDVTRHMSHGGYTPYFSARELAFIILMAALGAVVSVPLSYLSKALNVLPVLPFGSPQLLAGIHVLWLLTSALYTRRTGSALVTGAIKGLVETTLFSAQGITAIPISLVEGLLLEIGLFFLGRGNRISVAVSSGLSAVGNVIVLRLLVLYALPFEVIVFMAALAFVSGLVMGAFALRFDSIVKKLFR
jgi:ABC-type thiamin/hydroxymethylpyrimidine transport system permease subunit